MSELSDYTTSIVNGTEPDPKLHRLTPERSAQLAKRLRDLDQARKRSEVECRSYLVR